MGRRCTICYHQARAEIEAQILGHKPHAKIARSFGLGRGPVGRHAREHMKPIRGLVLDENGQLISQGQTDEDAALLASGSSQERLEWLIKEACALMAEAKTRSTVDVRNRVLSQCTKIMELAEKIAGRMPPDSTVQILQVIVKDE